MTTNFFSFVRRLCSIFSQRPIIDAVGHPPPCIPFSFPYHITACSSASYFSLFSSRKVSLLHCFVTRRWERLFGWGSRHALRLLPSPCLGNGLHSPPFWPSPIHLKDPFPSHQTPGGHQLKGQAFHQFSFLLPCRVIKAFPQRKHTRLFAQVFLYTYKFPKQLVFSSVESRRWPQFVLSLLLCMGAAPANAPHAVFVPA